MLMRCEGGLEKDFEKPFFEELFGDYNKDQRRETEDCGPFFVVIL